MMKHKTKVFPGYDCERGPCPSKGCPGYGKPNRPGGGHGIHGEEWHYSIVAADGRTALSLTVFTCRYPATATMVFRHPPRGVDLSFHSAVLSNPRAIAEKAKLPGDCYLLKGGRCDVVYTSGLVANDLFTLHGIDNVKQPKAFWTALEAAFVGMDRTERATWPSHGTTYVVCPHCEGNGYVMRVSTTKKGKK